MEKKQEYLYPDPEVVKGEKSLDDLAAEHNLDRPSARPVGVEQPETNPDHGKVHRMPPEHMVPLDEALENLDKK